MEYAHLSEQQIMSDPHWAHRLRQAAMEEYRTAGSTHSIIQSAYFRLLQLVPRGEGPEIIAPLLRIIETMRAFQRLNDMQRELLLGTTYRLHPFDIRYAQALSNKKDPDALTKLKVEYQNEIWASDPHLQSLRELLDQDHERAAEVDQLARDAHDAAAAAREQAKAHAPGYVLDLHKRGVRMAMTADGAVQLFPASLLTDADAAFAREYGAILADAIRAEIVAVSAR